MIDFIKKKKIKKLGKIYDDGEYIYKEGDVATGIFFVCEGHISLSMRNRIITILDKGEIFGLFSFDEKDSIRKTSAKVVGESIIIKIDRKKLIEKIHTDPSLAWKILNRTIDRLDMCETMFSNDFDIQKELEENEDNSKWNLINWLKNMGPILKK
jgi:CRP-like cAMP-binding protein